MKKYVLFLGVLSSLFLFSCRKNDTPSKKISRADITQGVEYTKDIYLWRDQLPSSMSAASFNDLEEIMEYIKEYSRDTVKPSGQIRNVDHWSFAIEKSEWDNISQGIAGDFGLGIFFFTDTDLRVKSVEKLSPAGVAGIKRGWQITKINDLTVNNSTDATIEKIVSSIFESSTVTITFKKPDGTSIEIPLKVTTYNEQPIYLDTIYNQSGGKTGYLVYNSFLGDSASVVRNMETVFNKFSAAGISNMIVDLRYNSGGYVWMQELLTNYLANNAAQGKVMYTESFNSEYATEFNDTATFNKKGSLNLSKLYIITSEGTASASELLINSLKPFTTVTTVGTRTEGKAVGFFAIPVGSWYIFPVSFRSLNANKEGNYFDGITPAVSATDGLDRNWGDIQESSLAAALAAINGGTARRALASLVPVQNMGINKYLADPKKVSGAIETRRRMQ